MQIIPKVFLVFCAALSLLGCGSEQWDVLQSARYTSNPKEAWGRLYVASSKYGIQRTLMAYDARTGLELWQVVASNWDDCSDVVVRSGYAVALCGRTLVGFNAFLGRRLWQVALEGVPQHAPVISREVVSIAVRQEGGAQSVILRSVRTGKPIVDEVLSSDSQVFIKSGRVFVASEQVLVVMSASTGDVLWQVRLEERVGDIVTSPAGIFVMSLHGILALDQRNGRKKWTRATRGQVQPQALGGLLCYAQSGALFGLDAETGSRKWRRRLSGMVDTPMLAPDMVYIHTAGGTLHALSTVDGESVWKLQVGAPGRHRGWNGEFYAWSIESEIHVVDLIHGVVLKTLSLRALGGMHGQDEGGQIDRPLVLLGPRLYGVEGGRRLFMRRLEPG